MPWVLVAIAVVWALSLMLVLALCLSARRLDTKIRSDEDVAVPPIGASGETTSPLDDIPVRRPALS